jgi:hypothetical protein
MAGREGLVDTAVKTAETGYMSRRLMKVRGGGGGGVCVVVVVVGALCTLCLSAFLLAGVW